MEMEDDRDNTYMKKVSSFLLLRIQGNVITKLVIGFAENENSYRRVVQAPPLVRLVRRNSTYFNGRFSAIRRWESFHSEAWKLSQVLQNKKYYF